MLRWILAASCVVLAAGCATQTSKSLDKRPLRGAALDAKAQQLMAAAQVPGLALAVIENGRIVHLRAYGERNVAERLPLEADTTMYAASLTKTMFAYAVMTLVDEGRIDLDRSIADYLPKPLPAYDKYADLAGDERWRKLTVRRLLDHTSGFPNFRFFTAKGYEPNAKLDFKFEPGSRFAYSGEGINLVQFVIENGLGIDVEQLVRERVFDRFDMRHSGMTWREDFVANVALGYDETGKALAHKQRSSARGAGSLDTTPADFAGFLAGLARCEGLSKSNCAEMLRPQIAIRSVQQFPTLAEDTTTANESIKLAYGLGLAVYESPRGPAWFKGGHDDGTNNLALCLAASRDCVLILSNSSNAESIFKYLVEAALGETCLPWFWENYIPYDRPELRRPEARAQAPVACARTAANVSN